MGLMTLASACSMSGVGGTYGITAPANYHYGRTVGGGAHGVTAPPRYHHGRTLARRTHAGTYGITPTRRAAPNVNAGDRTNQYGRNSY
ncbi:hypothetical protein M2281_002386 [Mesorhizobium soli]|nr:hypothetical protein [Mesorhizobium soli]